MSIFSESFSKKETTFSYFFRPLKSHDFVVRLTVFSLISRRENLMIYRGTSWKDAISCVISLLACLGESCAKFCSNPQLNFNKPNCCSVQFSSVCLLLCASPWPYVEDMLQITSPSLPVKFHHVFKMVETADEQMNLMNIYQTKSMVQSQTQKEKAACVYLFCLPVDKYPDFLTSDSRFVVFWGWEVCFFLLLLPAQKKRLFFYLIFYQSRKILS